MEFIAQEFEIRTNERNYKLQTEIKLKSINRLDYGYIKLEHIAS